MEFLRRALYLMDSSTFPVDTGGVILGASTSQVFRKSTHSGLITPTSERSERLHFAAPLVRVVLGQHLFSAPSNLGKLPRAQAFDKFLELSICPLRPSIPRGSLSKDHPGSRLYERAWQMEWYRAASTAVPEFHTVSPDVGPIFGSTGFLDFYVNNGLEWGVELLREGDRMSEHLERFIVDDRSYQDIPLGQCAILDFRHQSNRLQGEKENFRHVIYNDNFSNVEIRRKGHPRLSITILI